MYAVTNQNNFNQNFEGVLSKARGFRLPKQKFEEVQRIYEQKSKGLPDIELGSHYVQRDDGSTFRCADIMIGKDEDFMKGSESVSIEKLRLMFKDLPADKIAKAFVDLAKRAKLMASKFELDWELSLLKPKIAGVRRQAEESAKLGHTIHARRFDNFANILEQRAAGLEKQIEETNNKLVSIKISPYFDGWIF